MINIILLIIILGIISLSITKIIKERHKGNKCASCPYASNNGSCNYKN